MAETIRITTRKGDTLNKELQAEIQAEMARFKAEREELTKLIQ